MIINIKMFNIKIKLKAEAEKEKAALLEGQNFTVCQTNKSLMVFQEFPNNL